MRIKIKETGEIKTLTHTQNIEDRAMKIINSYDSPRFDYDEESDCYVVDQENYDWWVNWLESHKEAEKAKKDFLDSVDGDCRKQMMEIVINNHCSCDLENMPENIMQAIDTLKKEQFQMKFTITNESYISCYATSSEILQAIADCCNIDIDDIIKANMMVNRERSPELQEKLNIFDAKWADGGEDTEAIIKIAWTYAGEEEEELFWGDTHKRPVEKMVQILIEYDEDYEEYAIYNANNLIAEFEQEDIIKLINYLNELKENTDEYTILYANDDDGYLRRAVWDDIKEEFEDVRIDDYSNTVVEKCIEGSAFYDSRGNYWYDNQGAVDYFKDNFYNR